MEVTRDIRAFTPVFAGYAARYRNLERRREFARRAQAPRLKCEAGPGLRFGTQACLRFIRATRHPLHLYPLVAWKGSEAEGFSRAVRLSLTNGVDDRLKYNPT
jgi:hypothetical protein